MPTESVPFANDGRVGGGSFQSMGMLLCTLPINTNLGHLVQ